MENEKQYGRRRLVKKPTVLQKTEEPAKEPVKDESKKFEQGEQLSMKSKMTDHQPPKPDETDVDKTMREKRPKPPSRTGKKVYRPKTEKPVKPDGQRRTPRQPYTQRAPSPKAKKFGDVKLSVIIPAYNEVENIGPLLEQFNELFSKLPYRAEMIYVDDGSTDRTLIRAKEGQLNYPWLKVYSHRINRGLTAALETGFSKAGGKILCFYPADLQYHANEIPKMISKIDSGVDIVTGWKQGRYGLKSLGSFIYNKLSRWLFKIEVHDLNSIKAFKKEIVGSFAYRTGWHRYIIVMAAQAGYSVDEVRVKLYPRKSGKSKFGFWCLPAGFLDLLSVKFQLSFTKKPLLFFGSAGLISGILGVLIGLLALYMRFFLNSGYRPLLYAVILLVTSGLMLFAIGFLAELIVSIKDDIKQQKKNFLI